LKLARGSPARRATEPIVGAIVDVVLDTRRPPSASTRGALLSAVSSQRAASALELTLDAEDRDVRYTCGRVLVGMRENRAAELRFDPEARSRVYVTSWKRRARGA
jgi:hypothetical protein